MTVAKKNKSKVQLPPIPDKIFRRLAQHLQNAKLHKTLASLATCSKNLMEIVKPILWQEVMWTKATFKPAELFAKGRPGHFDHIRYIWLGSEGDGWFWKALFVHAPKDITKTFDELAHHFFPSLCFMAEVGKPNPDNPSNDNEFNVWLSARNVLDGYDYNAMTRLLLGAWNRIAKKTQYRGKVPRTLWELPELPSAHSNHDPVDWANAADMIEKRTKAKSGSVLNPATTFKTTLEAAAVWREGMYIMMGPIDVAIYINVLSDRKMKGKGKGEEHGLLPYYTKLFRIINGLFYEQQKVMKNEWVFFELFYWKSQSEGHPAPAWLEFMASYEDPLEHRRPQPPFRLTLQLLADIGNEYSFRCWAVALHLRIRALQKQSPFHVERLPQHLNIIIDDARLPSDLQCLFQADYSTKPRADIMRYGHTYKGGKAVNLLALGLFQGNCEIAPGRQMAEIMKRFDDWEEETREQLESENRPGRFTLDHLRGNAKATKEKAQSKKAADSSRP